MRRAVHAGLVVCAIGCAAWLTQSNGLASEAAESEARSSSAAAIPEADFAWQPAIAPAGPVVIVVSISEQRAYVYRNGVRIGFSAVSTGRPGYETPTGVFRILQKRREHYSNRYDNAPMPFMQRLTWDGVALHAGHVPAYPASHGCIRLPYEFAKRLFSLTYTGMIVVVVDDEAGMPGLSNPGFFAPVDAASGTPRALGTKSSDTYAWNPELAATGPLNVIVGTRAGMVVAIRGGQQIGRAEMRLRGESLPGSRLYLLLEGQGPGMSPVVHDRPARHWLGIPLPGAGEEPSWNLDGVMTSRRFEVDPAFVRLLYDALLPGTTLLITDELLTAATPVVQVQVLGSEEVEDASVSEDLP